MKNLSTFALVVTLSLAASAQKPECGTERWAVKTLRDPSVKQIHFTPQESTVANLRSPEAPPNLRKINPSLRLDQEKQVYMVHAFLLGYKREDDGDLHLVLADPDNVKFTMVAEIPRPDCANKAYAQQFNDAAAFISGIHKPLAAGKMFWLKEHAMEPLSVAVSGVFFFDFIHGQDGVAKNGAELHPVLRIREDGSK